MGTFDTTGIAIFAGVGFLSLFFVILPGCGYMTAMIGARIVTGDWITTCGIIGACIGAIPGAWLALELIKTLVKR